MTQLTLALDPMTAIERSVFALIELRTKSTPIPLAEIGCHADLSDRRVKAVVRSLRYTHGKPIGRRKGDPHGYWFAITPDDIAEAAGGLFSEGIATVIAAARMKNRRDIVEKMGQLSLDTNIVVRVQTLRDAAGEVICRQCSALIPTPREGQVFCSPAHRVRWSREKGNGSEV